MAALKFKVSGDTSGLNKSLGKAKGMLGGLAKAGAKMGLAAAFTGAATAAGGLAGAVVGVKRALNIGSEMSDIAANTGLLAGEAMVLSRAFEDAGISGDKLQPTINKMQRSIVEAGEGLSTPVRALEGMGLALSDLQGLAPAEQFAKIQNALAGMSDPGERAARAMQLFGRSGAELGALFSNGSAMENAAASVGGAAEILNRNANGFDRSADLLAGMGAKLDGLFVGMAEFINPVLMPMLEKLNTLDLAKYGQAAGRFVSVIAAAFSSDALPGMMKDGLILAAKSFVNLMVGHVRGLMAGVGEWLRNAPKVILGSFQALTNPDFWSGLLKILRGVGEQMGQAFLNILPAKLLDVMGMDQASIKAAAEISRGRVSDGAGQMKDALSGYISAVTGGGKAAASAYLRELKGAQIFDTSGEKESIAAAMRGIKDLATANQKAAEADLATKQSGGGASGGEEEAGKTMEGLGALKPVISSLAAVGGAAGLLGIGKNLDRERNGLLKSIERNTAKSSQSGPSVAVFA